MNIIVCIKQVPDTETKIQIGADGINTANIKWVMNPYDEFAVEEALKFKSLRTGSVVTAITVGPKSRVTEALRTALAMGVDEAIVIDASDAVDSHSAAKALAKAIQGLGPTLMVFTGKQAIDFGNATTTQIIAEYLKLPCALGVSKADYSESHTIVEREVDGGAKEIIQLNGPAVLGANKGLNTPRYASLPGIMKAKKKQIKELSFEALGLTAQDQRLKASGFQLPPDRPSVKMIDGDVKAQAAKLVQMLREEAKVL